MAAKGHSQPDQPCVETRDLWFAYERSAHVLRGISLTVQTGEFVGLVGQNGSGKTTLAKHFNGLLRPQRGEVLLHGELIGARPVSQLAHHVGYVFQNPDHQIFKPTVRDEIAFGPRNLGLAEADIDRRCDQAMEHFQIRHLAEYPPAVLGFGLRRKVSVAAVYAMQPQILILDEPTAGLDWKSSQEMMHRLCALHQQGHTIMLISHDMRLVTQYAQRTIVLREGEILLDGSTREVFQQAEPLRSAQIGLPQVCRLVQDLAPMGMAGGVLTVPEFCERYGALIDSREASDATRR